MKLSPATHISMLIVGIIFVAFVPPVGALILFVAAGSLAVHVKVGRKRRAHLAEIERQKRMVANRRDLNLALLRF